MTVPTHQDVLAKFSAIVARSLHIDATRVTEDAYLDDLGAESLDLIEISMGAEEAFNIWLSEKSILQTARDIYGQDVLDKDGLLSDAGKALLLARMPELGALPGEVTTASINRQFMRVSGWVTMIEELMSASVAACPKCGGEFLNAIAFKRKCKDCGQETALVSGEDINKKWVREYRASSLVPSSAAAEVSPSTPA